MYDSEVYEESEEGIAYTPTNARIDSDKKDTKKEKDNEQA